MNPEPRTITINGVRHMAVGQGESAVPSQHAAGHVTYQPPCLRRDIRRDIYDLVYGANRSLSRKEIADGLKLSKTPWLLQHIERLVSEGYLVKATGVWTNGFAMYFYEVSR